ncbi:MAG: DUF2283 domain-containing protein [Candidatus Margulisiibacteriota bacterium]
MKKPIVHFDQGNDVLYIITKKRASEEEFVEVAPGVNVELDNKRKVIGIEILNASNFLKPFLNKLHLKRA